MLTLPQTAEYALRAVCYIAEHEAEGPVPVSMIAQALQAPQNYLSKTLHHLGTIGMLSATRGARGGYRLGAPAAELRLGRIVAPFLIESEHRCLMGHTRCGDDVACGAHWRWKSVRDSARRFFDDVTLADLLTEGPARNRPTGSPYRSGPTPQATEAL